MVNTAQPSASFWQGRKVLVTGHTGFKGAWLSLWLAKLGATVSGFSDAVPTTPSLFHDLDLDKVVDDHRGDVCDFAALRKVIDEVKPDIILHLAAQSLVRLSYSQPVSTYATNVMGTVHVLEAARHQASVNLVLVVTSDKSYENREWVWRYRENDPMGGHDPYSNSKGCAELVTSAYARSFTTPGKGLQFVSARAGNVIGGGDWATDRLIPDLVRGLSSGTPVSIRSPDAIRPWQHVLEPLSGYLVLCERASANPSLCAQGWNFGPGADSEVTVRDVADHFCRLWPRENGWVDASGGAKLHEAKFLRLDCVKANSLLQWHARLRLEDALKATAEVYRSASKGAALRELLHSQIETYTGGGPRFS